MSGTIRTCMNVSLLVGGLVGGCATKGDAIETGQSTSSVALATTDDETGAIAIAFTSAENSARLNDVLSADPPRDFRWVVITVSSSQAGNVTSPSGYGVDVSNPTAGVSFAQSYPEQCNPAEGDNSRCWFIERLSAGDAGFTGSLFIQKSLVRVVANYDVVWEGTTTQFGNQPAYYKHGTSGGFVADLVIDGGAQ